MASNLTIKKVSQANLPESATNSTIIFTDNGKQYITLKDGKLLQITDIVQVATESAMPSVKYANTFYFVQDTKEMMFYDGTTLHKLSVNLEEVKAFFLNEQGKIKEEFMDEDKIVLKREYDAHVKGQTHITAEERLKWNAKFNMPEEGLVKSHLSAELIGLLMFKADFVGLDGKIKPELLSDVVLKSELLDDNNKIKEEYMNEASIVLKREYDAHVKGQTHITAEERIAWNKKYTLPETGIAKSDLSDEVNTILDSVLTDEKLTEHTGNADVHVTREKKAEWDSKYSKPSAGIGKVDLDADVNAGLENNVKEADIFDGEGPDKKIKQTLLPNIDINTEEIAQHVANSDIHTTAVEKKANADHIADGDIHVDASKKAEWDKKYVKPELGIPDTDLHADIKAKLDGAVQTDVLMSEGKVKPELLPEGFDTTAINNHMSNDDIHVTAEKKTEWDGKYTKPVGGIGEADIEKAIMDKVKGAVQSADLIADGKVKPEMLPEGFDTTAINNHMGDNNIHVTAEKKTEWDGKYTKPVGGINKADLHSDVVTGIEGNVKKAELMDEEGKVKAELLPPGLDRTEIDDHMTDNDIHVTKVEKDAWTAHKDNADMHVNASKKAEWDKKYVKPETGIPKEDLKDDVLDHVNLKNVGIYSHADIDAHIENDIIHSNGALGRWDFEGSQFDTAQKTNITVPQESTYFELSKIVDSEDEYESEGNLVTTVFDTLIEGCPFNASFYFGTYDRSVHTIKVYTRTGSTPEYDRGTWNDWVILDEEGKVKSPANRYVQLKVELLSADRFSTPQVKKVVVFYGRDVKDELKEAVGEYGSLSDRLNAMTELATHTNRDVLDKVTQEQLDKVNKIKDSFVKEVSVPTTNVVIPASEHGFDTKEDYDFEVRVFLVDTDSSLVPYMPKHWFVKEGQVTIQFSTDVPFVGKIVIK